LHIRGDLCASYIHNILIHFKYLGKLTEIVGLWMLLCDACNM